MDGTGLLVEPFGGEERGFLLDITRLRAVQAELDCGPVEVLRRLETGSWRVDDLRSVIFNGLIGAGATQLQATVLVRDHFDNQRRGYAQFVPLAHKIANAGVFGPEDDPLGEPQAGAKTRTRSRATKSGSATSSAPRQSSGGRRNRSAK